MMNEICRKDAPAFATACAGKSSNAGPGWIEGYAAVFDNVDSQGDVVRKGAFAKTIRERIPAGKVKLMIAHVAKGGSTMEVIGTVSRAHEDAHGLWIHADLSSDATAQEARTKVAEGHVLGLSIGYVPVVKAEAVVDGAVVTELKEVKLLEVTLTPFPANELAGVTSAKDATGKPPATATVPPVKADWGFSAVARRKLVLARLRREV
jgi:hypothetical protein